MNEEIFFFIFQSRLCFCENMFFIIFLFSFCFERKIAFHTSLYVSSTHFFSYAFHILKYFMMTRVLKCSLLLCWRKPQKYSVWVVLISTQNAKWYHKNMRNHYYEAAQYSVLLTSCWCHISFTMGFTEYWSCWPWRFRTLAGTSLITKYLIPFPQCNTCSTDKHTKLILFLPFFFS